MYVGLILCCNRISLIRFPLKYFSNPTFAKNFSTNFTQSIINRTTSFSYIRNVTQIFINRCPKVPSLLAPFTLFLLRPLKFQTAECKQSQLTRMDFRRSNQTNNPQFDWKEFWTFLRPDLVLLLLAIVVSDCIACYLFSWHTIVISFTIFNVFEIIYIYILLSTACFGRCGVKCSSTHFTWVTHKHCL